ncbi:hypothetical protein [Alistipes sp. ZOR0009]|uniref:hypothetical protein n=1 Tax=Alistipes sp. ZOR0009 TaxID=1339253 RepID=UPI00064717E5|nr:hypothetical protein [Alistipes sp. ZOR0009]
MEDFVVKSGETKKIYPRLYRFNNFIIETNATLIVPERSNQWLTVLCEGDIVIDGLLVYRKFYSEGGIVSTVLPDNTKIDHQFKCSALGGKGGNGGVNYGNPDAPGGIGVSGSKLFGGGGGAGGYWSEPSNHSGANASEWHGGVSFSNNIGGDGGISTFARHGGLVYFSSMKTFSGIGIIDLRGDDGNVGISGTRGWGAPGKYGQGNAGGGGGAPAGDGGRLIIKAKEVLLKEPEYKLEGGKGGKGGMAGNANETEIAQNGEDGGDGCTGYVEFPVYESEINQV